MNQVAFKIRKNQLYYTFLQNFVQFFMYLLRDIEHGCFFEIFTLL